MLAEKDAYPVSWMAKHLNISCSGFYSWVSLGSVEDKWDDVRQCVKRIWLESDRRFGSRSIKCFMPAQHKGVSLYGIQKCMRELGIKGCTPYKTKRTTIPNKSARPKPDLIKRDFTSPVPTHKLVGGYYLASHRTRLALPINGDWSQYLHGGWLVDCGSYDLWYRCQCLRKCTGTWLRGRERHLP